MGKREEQDSKKALCQEEIKVKTRFSLLDLLLWPIRVYKQKRREAEIRKDLIKQYSEEGNWTYDQVPQNQLPPEDHEVGKDDWLYGIVSDDNKKQGE